MTNVQIITMEAIAQGIYTEEQATNFFSAGQLLPLFTYAEWKHKGFQVKRGEKACMKASIWMKKKKKADEDEDKKQNDYYIKTASFFRPEQVEEIKAN